MQLPDLIKPISEQSDEELKERLFALRHRRDVERPAAQARKKQAEKKESNKANSAAEKLLGQLSPEELSELLRTIGQ